MVELQVGIVLKESRIREALKTLRLSPVGGRSTQKARVSWLIVSRGFGGRRVFHNDTERLRDMHKRGHPALSLLIPDSSFSLDPTVFSAADEAVRLLLDQSESQGARTHAHIHMRPRVRSRAFMSCGLFGFESHAACQSRIFVCAVVTKLHKHVLM